MKINTIKEIRDLYKTITLEDGSTKKEYPGDLTGYLINNSIHVPLEPNNRLYKKIQKLIKEGFNIEPAYTEEKLLNTLKNNLINEITQLADNKSKDLKNYIAGKRVTQEQKERYEAKYQMALKAKETNDYSMFLLEANNDENQAKELVETIIKLHDKWLETLDYYNTLIDQFRVRATNLVQQIETFEQINKAEELLERAKQFNINTTPEDVIKLFEEFENA